MSGPQLDHTLIPTLFESRPVARPATALHLHPDR